MDDLITLISVTYTQNEIGEQMPIETEIPVWATLQSISRAELYDGGVHGLNPDMVAVTAFVNYSGEQIAEVGGKRYGIYRTYAPPNTDSIELYLERKVGLR